MDVNKFRKQVREWLEISVLGKKIFNISINAYIIVNRKGLKHALSFSNQNYVQKLKSMYSLETLIKESKLYKIEQDKRARQNIHEIIKLRTEVVIEEENYKAEIIVRHTNEGRFYYDHILIKKEAINM